MAKVNTRPGGRCQRGASLLEVVVLTFIIALLMTVAYKRFEQMAEDVERVSFQGARLKMQAQITLKVAEWYAAGESQSRTALRMQNPAGLIYETPDNYAGEVVEAELKTLPGQRWYFVTDRHWLVYKALRTEGISNQFSETDILVLQLDLQMQQPERDHGMVLEARLQPVFRFDWQPD
ncbi:type II secretion system protein [Neptuniibacter halophilus]|uniref:type II secretion system protein n=1 Tax=Neptuniibacter halophilus TaxID=651666 RepID=UPI0025738E78|nr:hypothetical protein [Neptuniibacter halophilus]